MNKFYIFNLYFFTLKDVGFKRIIYRIIFILRREFDKFFFKYIIKFQDKNFLWNKKILTNLILLKYKREEFKENNLNLYFLNINNIISLPIDWEDKNKSRLWNFNLNYFDWAIILLEEAFNKKKENNSLSKIEFLIDSWIIYSYKFYTDGWHSYTLSLRIRNWIWLFRICPQLITEKRLESLWVQTNWLYNHQEEYLGGNHYLENLMTLVLSSLQFSHDKAKYIFQVSLSKLKKNLELQLLYDGGHEERSASYHFYLLKRLVETALLLEHIKDIRPKWLIKGISKMTVWSKKVYLIDNKYPRFNDSFLCSDLNLNEIINFAQSYIDRNCYLKNKNTLLYKLTIKLYKNQKNKLNNFNFNFIENSKEIIDLPDTGFTILRPGEMWEILFKTGLSSPKYLSAHSHSDILSFDIFQNGTPALVETGTSNYENLKIRNYERSGRAHNMMLLSENQYTKNDFSFIEPVEIWDSFKAARKSTISSRSNGVKQNLIWSRCKFIPYSNLIISQERSIFAKVCNGNLDLRIVDKVISSKKIYWYLFFHLPPNRNKDYLYCILDNENNYLNSKWIDSWTAYKYGIRYPSKTLLLFGMFEKGENIKESILNLKK